MVMLWGAWILHVGGHTTKWLDQLICVPESGPQNISTCHGLSPRETCTHSQFLHWTLVMLEKEYFFFCMPIYGYPSMYTALAIVSLYPWTLHRRIYLYLNICKSLNTSKFLIFKYTAKLLANHGLNSPFTCTGFSTHRIYFFFTTVKRKWRLHFQIRSSGWDAYTQKLFSVRIRIACGRIKVRHQ